MASPLLAGIPISSRFAEKLGIAEEKQSQQQMTHTKSSTQDGKDWEQNLYEKSDIYRGLKDAYTAPMRAIEGNLDPYSPDGVLEAINLAGTAMVGGIPGGASKPGELGIIGRVSSDMYKKLTPGIQQMVDFLSQQVKSGDLHWREAHYNDPDTGRNFFFGPDKKPMVEFPDVKSKLTDPRKQSDFIGGTDYTYNAMFTTSLQHPDPLAYDLLRGPTTRLNMEEGKGNYFKPSVNKWIPPEINVETARKKEIYATESKARKQADTWGERKSIQEKIIQIENKRKILEKQFGISYLAHEATHALQHKTGAPSGGNPRAEASKIFAETIGNNPDKLLAYNHANDLATQWLASDPMTLMVALSKISKNKATYTKYIDMLYKSGDNDYDSKFFIRKEIKDSEGKVEGVDFIPDRDRILTEITRDAAAGKLELKGTALEPWQRMNEEAFQAYKHKHGEVYARIAERRALKASKGDTDIYKTNPNENMDVDPENITFTPTEKGLLGMSAVGVNELEQQVNEDLKRLDNTGYKRLPGAAGKRDSDVQPTFLQKMYKEHPDLVKSKPSELEKLEIKLRRIYKLPEEEIEDIMLPLWSTYLRNQKPDDPAEEHTQKTKMKKWTENEESPLLTAVEKLAGMIEGMNKPRTVIRDKDGRIMGVA
jgi:hypothetical protein